MAEAKTPPSDPRYADGAPFDEITYLEAKLILKPDRFTAVKDFRAFGKIVKKTAKQTGVGFAPAKVDVPEVREITFFDTPAFDFYNNAFILRRRITFKDGFAVGDPEIVFKFRHPEEAAATAVDVRPLGVASHRIKFKAEALPLKDRVGGYRLLYSHNCQFGLSEVHESHRTSLETLHRVFPALSRLNGVDTGDVTLVNEGIVEELLLPLGILDFGGGLKAKCDISLWRTRGAHLPLVGEFAFQARFDSRRSVGERQKALAAAFYLALQKAVEPWLALGVTKTAMVYRLNGTAPQSHE